MNEAAIVCQANLTDVSDNAIEHDETDFWRAQLNGAPGLLALPLDHMRSARQSRCVSSCNFTLRGDLVTRLRQLSARHQNSLLVTLTAAWSAWLSRMSTQTDIVIGSAAADSSRTVLTPLRVRLDGDPSVVELLAQMRDLMRCMDTHPAPRIDALALPNSSHHPVFQAAIVYAANAADGPRALSMLDTALDVGLCCVAQGDHIDAQLVYAKELIDADTALRWSHHFQNLLAGIVADDQVTLGRLPILTPDECRQLLGTLNSAAAIPPTGLIQQRFEIQVQEHPDAVAIIDAGTHLTYAQLNHRANHLAHQLIALGVGPDRPVALCAERSADLIVGLLGILKAGAAYVPLDPSHPPERLSYMLADCKPAALVAQTALLARLPKHALAVIALDGDTSLPADLPQSNPDSQQLGLSPSHLAYIIYTSGSTGEPKGVMVEHRNVLSLIFSDDDAHADIKAGDCVVHCANPAFDAATWEIWGALLNGARLLIITPAELLDPGALKQTLILHGATILHLTVGIFNQYAEALADVFPTLKSLLFGGDQSDAGKVMQVLRNSRPARLIHCYGPTETTTFATTFVVDTVNEAPSLPIGKPIAHRRLYLLDDHLMPVPIGVPGEIYIGGAGIARGYLNQAGLTAERFVNDPFAHAPQARMYKTGDIGRWLADGNIAFLGRNDAQVKIRGFRVELGEIEARLSAHPQVRDAVVLARDGTHGDKQLVAYFTAAAAPLNAALDFDWSDMLKRALNEDSSTRSAPTPSALQSFIKTGLPDYMVPIAYIALEAMPLTTNGKLDRKALPPPSMADYASRPYEDPQGTIEMAIAGLWAELLGLERIGRNDNFFMLGGHSILAVQLAARLSQRFGTDVTLGDIGAQPTLRELAELIGTL